ncbi:MAG: bifunctional diaminohydroxyphosphoribosylaminopyrimidine deaminase/5-amino-6-(5-phosphoribosylamino)uracil reductase RibD [Candidatus Poribacteria bacterium]|nr:bifunctional diaminohydroxyphosphoribosylaminopyrimidine deaminase/5-amino-6-(5-phosphoribosylamino)uracil reductase RibD [Candidatus Poribacteria bacterium]
MNKTHIAFMNHALNLAERGKGRTSPNPLVGAVIVNAGKIVGEGYHQKAGEPHAEVHALRTAGEEAKGATLYVNLEPCCHWGRTPPCTESLIQAGITHVYVAHNDPNPMVSGKGIAQLEEVGITVNVGICEEEAVKLNEIYIKYMKTRYPFVILKTAMSLDGKIATSIGESRWITSEASRQKAHELRDEVDAILVGIGTIFTDNPALTTRLPNKTGKDATRIILDSHGRTPTSAKVFNPESDADVIIAVTPQAFANNVALLKIAGAEVIVIPANEGQVCFKTLMETLGARGITSVLVEGGGRVNSSVLASGIVDKVVCFVAPKFIGGKEAPGVFGGKGITSLADAPELDRYTITQLDRDLLIEGYFDNNVHRNN